MAHDFEIRVKNAPVIKKIIHLGVHTKEGWIPKEDKVYNDVPDEYKASFFGYAEGIMYRAFGMEEHCMGWSGDNVDIEIDRNTAIKGISKAIELFNQINYPDPKRMDEIKAFYQRMLNEFKDYQEYIICYS